MKSIRHIAAGTLAAAAVLVPAAAHADTPYAQASAAVAANGMVSSSKNVSDVRRVERGVYCLVLDEDVDLTDGVAIHVTPIGRYTLPRSLSVQRGSRVCEHRYKHDDGRRWHDDGRWHGDYRYGDDDRYRDADREHTVAVFSRLGNGSAADTGFYLTVQ